MRESMRKNCTTFRVGKVTAYKRGSVWYLRYVESAKRHQPRIGCDLAAVQQAAAETNANSPGKYSDALAITDVPGSAA
jgi:hypothetical protein